MEKRVNILISLMLALLGLNIYLLFMIRDEDPIIHCSGSSNYWQIQELAEKIEEYQENRWVISRAFNPNNEASSPDALHLDLEWSFSEIEQAAPVYLLYRSKGDHDWIKIPASPGETGLYRASLVLSSQLEYEYQILAEGSIFRNSGITALPPEYYRREPLELRVFETDTSEALVLGYQRIPFQIHKPKKARAWLSKDRELLQTLILEFEDSSDDFTYTRIWPLQDADQILLEYEFYDGQIYRAIIMHEHVFEEDPDIIWSYQSDDIEQYWEYLQSSLKR